jgi:hypothetical protein
LQLFWERRWTRVPIERRIRQGAERNAGVLDPDVDRFLDSVVHKTRRRQVVRRSLSAAACVAAIVLAVAIEPDVLRGTTGGSVPGDVPAPSVVPSVTSVVPLVTGVFTRSIPEGKAIVRANGIAGAWTINAGADGRVVLLAPASFAGAHASHPFQMQTGTLTTDAFGSDICAGKPAGTYSWTVQGGFLLFSPVSDRCDPRVFILGAQPWPSASS